MGWAGPAQPTGPDSAPKVLGRFRTKMDWADLGPKNNILFWARPGPEYRAGPDSAQKAGLGQDPPGPDQNGRGELISPHPCMQNAIRSACREGKTNKNQKKGRGKKSYLARSWWRRWCCRCYWRRCWYWCCWRRRRLTLGRRQWRCC